MNELAADLEERLRSLAPSSVVLVGAAGRSLVDGYLGSSEGCALTVANWEAMQDPAAGVDGVSDTSRYDLGLVCWTEATVPPACCSRVIARLRDLHARHLWVLTTLDAPSSGPDDAWTASSLVALGLTRVRDYPEWEPALYLYAFDLGSYKPTPKWLGPEHWAHPDRWDKERW